MNRTSPGRALFYTRDSGGKHENTPGEYVAWAQRQARELGLAFDGTPERIEAMIREGRAASGDLYIDYGVPGNILSRNGLSALLKRAIDDPHVTHVFIPRRDRLARPDDPLDGVQLESVLRKSGKTLVFMDRTLPPLAKGRKADIAELLVAVLDYDRSEKDRRDLAQKILFAQLQLAKLGFSTGGRAPYGFERWLVKEDGTPVRQLQDGERVRLPGHHVVWLPRSEEKLAVVRRILKMLQTMPASRVAAMLTAEGIPSPDSGRFRKDNGIPHLVSGVWHQTTITNIARNPLLVAMATYGVRSMGDKLRFTPEGPRELEEEDYRFDDKPKVVRNPEAERIMAPAKFQPLVDPEEHGLLVAQLDARGGRQRGKPRSKDPAKNPLGCRIFDLNCTWPMYREPYNGSFRYKCGLYQQSHGQKCAHNHVDGPTATRFLLSCVRQRLLSPSLLAKLERRLRDLAGKEAVGTEPSRELTEKRVALAKIDVDLEKVSRNMALAESPEQYKAIAGVFDGLKTRKASLEAEIAEAESTTPRKADLESEIEAAMGLARRLTELAEAPVGIEAAGEVFRLTNARLFLGFRPVREKKRTLNRVIGGVATFGAAPAPAPIYEGPTGRKGIKGPEASDVVGPDGDSASPPPECVVVSGEEDKSLGNVSRGDWI